MLQAIEYLHGDDTKKKKKMFDLNFQNFKEGKKTKVLKVLHV